MTTNDESLTKRGRERIEDTLRTRDHQRKEAARLRALAAKLRLNHDRTAWRRWGRWLLVFEVTGEQLVTESERFAIATWADERAEQLERYARATDEQLGQLGRSLL